LKNQMNPADLYSALTQILPTDAILTDAATQPYCRDWRGRFSGAALAVVFPANTQQVADIVKFCAANRIAIVPQGGNTSLCGAGVPLATGDQIVVNLSRMAQIRSVDAANYTLTVEAGCTLASIYTAAAECNRLFPLGLTAIAPHCEIGGNLSTNAGGIGVLRYGNARDLVLGLEVVLPDGQVWNGLRSLRKDNTGYDLKHLFIGAEGTLGIITAAVLKLFPRPQSTATACVAIASLDAATRLLAHIRSHCGDTLSGFELISRSCLELVFKNIPNTQEPFAQQYDYYLLIKLTDVQTLPLDNALRAALQNFGTEILAFDTTTGDAEHWWTLRKNIAEAQKREGLSIKHDIAVPISRVAEFITRANAALRAAYPNIRIVAFGHLGDGNIHYNASLPDPAANTAFIQQEEHAVNTLVYEVVRDLNGSISAEHGIGQLKRDTLPDYKTPLELELMRKIKATLDPLGVMNPGKVV
jgi:FAD/FMN-containing dehydrogenase